MSTKTCPHCKKQFECRHLEDCWCIAIKLTKEQLDKLNKTYVNCLCESCLQQFSENKIENL